MLHFAIFKKKLLEICFKHLNQCLSLLVDEEAVCAAFRGQDSCNIAHREQAQNTLALYNR